jgi:hypothetical protein
MLGVEPEGGTGDPPWRRRGVGALGVGDKGRIMGPVLGEDLDPDGRVKRAFDPLESEPGARDVAPGARGPIQGFSRHRWMDPWNFVKEAGPGGGRVEGGGDALGGEIALEGGRRGGGEHQGEEKKRAHVERVILP